MSAAEQITQKIGNKNSFELSLKRFSIFDEQNVEEGNFDVIFQFNKKELFAHSFILWSASEIFKAKLVGPISNKDPIPITGHSYDDFKEFLTFLYLGQCEINMKNVMAIVDLAESYNIQILKDECDKYLSGIEPTFENLYTLYEKLKLRSLETALEKLYEYISYNAEIILINLTFMSAKKDFVIDVVKMETLSIKEENLFDAILKWAKCRFNLNTENHDDKASDDKQRIKDDLAEIFPHIRFPIMNTAFLHKFIVSNGYLFSSLDELSNILCDADSYDKAAKDEFIPKLSSFSNKPRKYYNKIIFNDQNGNKAFAFIPDKEILEALKPNEAHSNIESPEKSEYCWEKDIPKPRQERMLWWDGTKYYVFRSAEGKLGLKEFPCQNVIQKNRANQSNADFIAKLHLEDEDFCVSQGCQFKVDAANAEQSPEHLIQATHTFKKSQTQSSSKNDSELSATLTRPTKITAPISSPKVSEKPEANKLLAVQWLRLQREYYRQFVANVKEFSDNPNNKTFKMEVESWINKEFEKSPKDTLNNLSAEFTQFFNYLLFDVPMNNTPTLEIKFDPENEKMLTFLIDICSRSIIEMVKKDSSSIDVAKLVHKFLCSKIPTFKKVFRQILTNSMFIIQLIMDDLVVTLREKLTANVNYFSLDRFNSDTVLLRFLCILERVDTSSLKALPDLCGTRLLWYLCVACNSLPQLPVTTASVLFEIFQTCGSTLTADTSPYRKKFNQIVIPRLQSLVNEDTNTACDKITEKFPKQENFGNVIKEMNELVCRRIKEYLSEIDKKP